ncbi:MAG: oligosaccharide flippase family protein, partial [Candidatus Bathyarchaeota archaeon]|nr:oligosaccharide flippase family protein [Candidatus Bathyarchaeota archaeon]
MSLGRVVKGAVWLSIGIIFSNFFGFIYWLIISKIVDVNVIGKVAIILGIEALVIGFINLGIPMGIQRFIGAFYNMKDYEKLSQYYCSTIVLLFALSFAIGAPFLATSLMGWKLFSLEPLSLFFLSILIICGFNGWSALGYSFLNGILKTEYAAIIQISSSLIRLIVSLLLIYLGYDFVGLMMGYVAAGLLTSILTLVIPIRILKRLGAGFSLSIISIKDAIKAGTAVWVPNILTLLGQWVGVLGIFSMIGLVETGLYFIALMITSIIMSLPQSILTLSFPSISGMLDGKKRVMFRTVKISASFMAPMAFFLISYPSILPEFLSETYTGASELIRILAIGYLILPMVAGYTYYAYAIGKYKDVLTIGLAGTIPRLLLYPIMIGLHGDIGAAVTFSIGNATALIAVITCARKVGYNLHFREYLKVVIIP